MVHELLHKLYYTALLMVHELLHKLYYTALSMVHELLHKLYYTAPSTVNDYAQVQPTLQGNMAKLFLTLCFMYPLNHICKSKH